MRIISGSKKGKKLQTLEGYDVRPTTDWVKEALFDILQFRLEGRRFLDLFAGSGQIGLEALSRGAREAVFVDASRTALRVVEKNVAALEMGAQARIVPGDFAGFLRSNREPFDIAFLDPPYKTGLLEQALPLVIEAINPGGIVICEHPREEALPLEIQGFCLAKSYRYGRIMLSVYRNALLG